MANNLSFLCDTNSINVVFNLVSEGICVIDDSSICMFMNQAALKMLGYKSSECIGKNIHSLIGCCHPEGSSNFQPSCPIYKSIEFQREKRQKNKTFCRADGTSLYVNYISTPIDNQAARGAIITFSQIPKQKSGCHELQRNTTGVDAMINATKDLIWAVDSKLKLTTANQSFYEAMALLNKAEVIPGDSVFPKGFDPFQLDRWKSYYQRGLSGEAFSINDTLFSQLTGMQEHVQVSFNPILDENGKPEGIACSLKRITDEVNNKLALEKAKCELQKMLNSSVDIICTLDRNGRFISVNEASYSILGYRPQEMEKHFFYDFVLTEDRDPSIQVANNAINGIEISNFQNHYIHKKGYTVPLVWSARPDMEDHNILYCVGRDVTERKRSEEQVRMSEQRFKNLVQNGSDLIAILDVDGNYQYVSPTSMAVLNIPPEDFIGKNAFDFVHPEDIDWLIGQFARLAGEKQLVIPEYRFKDKQGNWRWMETIISNMLDDPTVRGIVANSRDITTRKQAEISLKNSEEKYRLLFQYGPLPKWIYDIETLEILDVNLSALKKYGYSREEFLRLTIKDLRPDSEIPALMKAYTDASKTREEINCFGIYTHKKKNGQLIRAEIWGHRFDYEGRDCMIALADDVTEREEVLNQLKASEEKLRIATKIAALGYWQLDLEQNKLTWSEEVYQIWGISPGQIEPDLNYLIKTMPFTDRASFLDMQAASLRGERELDYEHRVILPNGAVKWVQERGRIIKAANGQPLIFGGTVQDVTSKKLLELSLQESNQRYDLVTQATSDVIWDWNITNNNLFLAKSFKDVFGHSMSGPLLKIDDKNRYVHPDDYQRFINSLNHAIEQKSEHWECEYRYRRSDDSYAYVVDKGIVIMDAKGKAIRVVGSLRDISEKKSEEHQLKLLESVVTYASDAVLILEHPVAGKSSPSIIYANEAFTGMTGYSLDELIGQATAILRGPETGQAELDRLYNAIANKESCEVTLVNYKKNGQPFWNRFSLSPVSDHTAAITHWIAIGRDITKRKAEEICKSLMGTISSIFNNAETLPEATDMMLQDLIDAYHLDMAEVWLLDTDEQHISCLTRAYREQKLGGFYATHSSYTRFHKGEGFPGLVWEDNKTHIWNSEHSTKEFSRSEAAKQAGLRQVLGIPLTQGEQFIGVLTLGLPDRSGGTFSPANFADDLIAHIAVEIKRKQLEQELRRIFQLSPDIICTLNQKGRFLKINPSAFRILGYTQEELLRLKLMETVHSDDHQKLSSAFATLSKQQKSLYIELRHLTPDTQTKWMAWTLSGFPDEGLIFAVAKDISEKKQLELLLEKTSELARIGSWKIDLVNDATYWSPMIFKLLEFDSSVPAPAPFASIEICKPGESRDRMTEIVNNAITSGTPFDVEVQVETARGNDLWVRVIGEARMSEGKCIELYGSLQDINPRKTAQIAVVAALNERNNILESIGDGFFAVDHDWIVTYWNRQAEKVLFGPKDAIIGKRLWDVFKDSIDSLSYSMYHEAISKRQVLHFEDWYEPLQRWFGISAYPSANGLSVYFKDITAAKQARQELEELNQTLLQRTVELEKSESRYAHLFNLSPQPMWVYDLQSLRFLDVNNAAVMHYGFTKEEFMSMTLKDIRPAENLPALKQSIAAIPAKENHISQGNYLHRKKNGELIEVEIYGNTILYKGELAEIVFAIDVTERQTYINAIREQNKKLMEIAWFQSHVTRIPVARILGLALLLEDETSEESIKEIVGYIVQSTHELDEAIIAITQKIDDINVIQQNVG